MFMILDAHLEITVWFRAMKIVIIHVFTKITEFNTKPSKELNSVHRMEIKIDLLLASPIVSFSF